MYQKIVALYNTTNRHGRPRGDSSGTPKAFNSFHPSTSPTGGSPILSSVVAPSNRSEESVDEVIHSIIRN